MMNNLPPRLSSALEGVGAAITNTLSDIGEKSEKIKQFAKSVVNFCRPSNENTGGQIARKTYNQIVDAMKLNVHGNGIRTDSINQVNKEGFPGGKALANVYKAAKEKEYFTVEKREGRFFVKTEKKPENSEEDFESQKFQEMFTELKNHVYIEVSKAFLNHCYENGSIGQETYVKCGGEINE